MFDYDEAIILKRDIYRQQILTDDSVLEFGLDSKAQQHQFVHMLTDSRLLLMELK